MSISDFANFAVSWSGAAIAWVGAFNTNRKFAAEGPRVVASTISVVGGLPTIEIVNVGGKGATDVRIELEKDQVGYRGGLSKEGVWQTPIPIPSDGASLVVVGCDAAGKERREAYVIRSDATGYRLSR